jgi:hypothetical protein
MPVQALLRQKETHIPAIFRRRPLLCFFCSLESIPSRAFLATQNFLEDEFVPMFPVGQQVAVLSVFV